MNSNKEKKVLYENRKRKIRLWCNITFSHCMNFWILALLNISKISFEIDKKNETAINREIYLSLLFPFMTGCG